MAINHGVFVSEKSTSVSTPVVAESGIPFVIGSAPVHASENPAAVGIPVLCTSWDEFESKFGYSDDWEKFTLCEFAYSHFKLYGCQPVIFCNLLDPATMQEAVAADDMAVVNRRVELPVTAIPSTIVVKADGGDGSAYVLDEDYSVYQSGEHFYIELDARSAHAAEAVLNVAYSVVKPDNVTAALVASSMDAIELCMSTAGVIPDLICAPGFSQVSSVAAVMATKAAGINSLFPVKALVDIDSSAAGCESYDQVSAWKQSKNLVDANEILPWPMGTLGDRKFHMSTQIAGLIASVDASNGCPYESPSNKGLKIDGLCTESGKTIVLTKAQADTLNACGVVTALNFLSSGWVAWGNYTACYPTNTDVKDYFIPVSRMFDWVGRSLIQSVWSKLDKPMNRRLLDTILDSANIWLNGLVGAGYLLGARAEILDDENPTTDLMAGIVRIHLYMTPPSPAQEIDFVLEYDAAYVEAAFA
ncbi:MAG: phage tail sheath family protein [Aristaeellaceae bacterium]